MQRRSLNLASAILVFASLVSPAKSQLEVRWTGEPDIAGNWQSEANWSPEIPSKSNTFAIGNRAVVELRRGSAETIGGRVFDQSLLRLDESSVTAERLILESNSRIEMVGGTLDVRGAMSSNLIGVYDGSSISMTDGFIRTPSLTISSSDEDKVSSVTQSRGVVHAEQIWIQGSSATLDLVDAELTTHHVNLVFVPEGSTGLRATDSRLLAGTISAEGGIELSGGVLHVARHFHAGLDDPAQLRVHGATTIDTAVGSSIVWGDQFSAIGSENLRIRLAADSTFGIPSTWAADSLPLILEHDNAVVYAANSPLEVKSEQRAQIGGAVRSGLIVDGFAYDSSARGPARVRGSLQVGPGGVARFSDRSAIEVRDDADAIVREGELVGNELVIRGQSAPSQLSVHHGEVRFATIKMRGGSESQAKFTLNGGTVQADSMQFQGYSHFDHVGGDSSFQLVESLSRDANSILIAGGRLHASEMAIRNRIAVRQTGGRLEMDRVVLESGRLELVGGETNIESELFLFHPNGTIDFASRPSTLNIKGGIVLGETAPQFLNAELATLNIDAESLVVLPRDADIGASFANVNNQAVLGVIGEDVTIPASRTVRGTANLERFIRRINVDGQLLGERHSGRGGGLQIGEFTLGANGTIDIPNGGAILGADSEMFGGTLQMQFLSIGSQRQMLQHAGDSTIAQVSLLADARYQLAGGSLTIDRILDGDGTIDFANSSATLHLSSGAILDLRQINFQNFGSATFVSDVGSLIMLPNQHALDPGFGSFESNSLQYIQGERLRIPSGREVNLPIDLDDGLDNDGTLILSDRVRSTRTISVRDYVQTDQAILHIDIMDDPIYLSVSGAATLGGKLTVENVAGLEFEIGDRLQVVRAGAIIGTFDEWELPPVLPELAWRPVYEVDALSLEVVPWYALDGNVLGDLNGNGQLDHFDVDALLTSIQNASYDVRFDTNGDGMNNIHDLKYWITDLRQTYFGDANLDGEFSSADLVEVFSAGQYEDAVAKNSTWATGDWSGDGDFSSSDMVLAFQDGGYEQGPRSAVAVPEPERLSVLGALGMALFFRGAKVKTSQRRTIESCFRTPCSKATHFFRVVF